MRSNTILKYTSDITYSIYSSIFKSNITTLIEKKHRSRSDFASNKTASLAVPETPEKKFVFVEVKKPIHISSTYSINSMINSFMSLVVTSASAAAAPAFAAASAAAAPAFAAASAAAAPAFAAVTTAAAPAVAAVTAATVAAVAAASAALAPTPAASVSTPPVAAPASAPPVAAPASAPLVAAPLAAASSSAPPALSLADDSIKNKDPIAKRIIELEANLRISKKMIDTDNLILEKVELLSEEIKEHAARRVDLFFYLLVSVWGKNIIITKDSTLLQHGKGSDEKGTQACHSSLFPNVKFAHPPSSWSWLMKPPPCPTFEGTHFRETLNMTVELPHIVNSFDGRLEGRIKPTAYINNILLILNKVSSNEMQPIEGMNEFLKVMETFFSKTEKKLSKANHAEAFKKVWSLQKEGTFYAATKGTCIVDNEYLCLMLRLKEADINKARDNPKVFLTYFSKIQEEIFDTTAHKSKGMKMK